MLMPIEDYPHPALTADVVLLAARDNDVQVLLIQRSRPPFEGAWAFPGGFVNVGESPETAALRELEEETGIRDIRVQQLRTFGDPGRDPRGHIVTVTYLGVMPAHAAIQLKAGDDAARACWWSVSDLPPLAFDHADILDYALERLSASSTDPTGRGSSAQSVRAGKRTEAAKALYQATETEETQ
jgi:8-oxo-dGTP diphosphatase